MGFCRLPPSQEECILWTSPIPHVDLDLIVSWCGIMWSIPPIYSFSERRKGKLQAGGSLVLCGELLKKTVQPYAWLLRSPILLNEDLLSEMGIENCSRDIFFTKDPALGRSNSAEKYLMLFIGVELEEIKKIIFLYSAFWKAFWKVFVYWGTLVPLSDASFA